MMDAETWMTAQEALEKGFIDRIAEGKKAESNWDMSVFDNVPEVLKAKSIQEEPENTPEEPNEPEYDRAGMERRIELIEMG
jgi:hypothetical protein